MCRSWWTFGRPGAGLAGAWRPRYAQAARQLEPQVRVVKVNTEEAPDLASRYAIRSIPTLALFRGGREIARQAGAMDSASIVAWARSHT